ncbi:MAG: phosphatidylserine decarboxylase family protein [Micavibrio aeruginosavorus]|uniref:Phosphatidylserine decarboxylase proenzyme n=1 Tax=Micavibrio aeruginosavorus TaxID=349221 RepID=A0A2W5FSV7_9BACT|nr:MAG: phosphatidylserine decarboxylase family protein [Micavibrio aeruginosavorus]
MTIKQTMFTPTHKAGWPFILGFALVTIILSFLWEGFALIGLVLTLWCVYFFRDPARYVPLREGLIVSPGDGRVTQIVEACQLPPELRGDAPLSETDEDGDYTRISIFLSVFDVHVNRSPVSGIIKKVVYKPGIFLNAGNDRASMENERCAALIAMPNGKELGVVQIAGLIARRILCDLSEGQEIAKGERYGIIRFGSRMDVYLPEGVAPLVSIGQRMIGGETVLGDYSSSEAAREAASI